MLEVAVTGGAVPFTPPATMTSRFISKSSEYIEVRRYQVAPQPQSARLRKRRHSTSVPWRMPGTSGNQVPLVSGSLARGVSGEGAAGLLVTGLPPAGPGNRSLNKGVVGVVGMHVTGKTLQMDTRCVIFTAFVALTHTMY